MSDVNNRCYVEMGILSQAAQRLELIKGCSQNCSCDAFEIANDFLNVWNGFGEDFIKRMTSTTEEIKNREPMAEPGTFVDYAGE